MFFLEITEKMEGDALPRSAQQAMHECGAVIAPALEQ
jgi:hypothetical protein